MTEKPRQRKLTADELCAWNRTRAALDDIPAWREWPEWNAIRDLRNAAAAKVRHGTSDGLPFVEPAPEPEPDFVPTDAFVIAFEKKQARWPRVLVRSNPYCEWRERSLIRVTDDRFIAFSDSGKTGAYRFCILAPGEPRDVEGV